MVQLLGPGILARTIGTPTVRGKSKRAWQYHSRSDSHSKVACWTVLFDLLRECDVLHTHARKGRLGFGINHVMVGPINKTLDLVVTVVPPERDPVARESFASLVGKYGIALDAHERSALDSLPPMFADRANDVSEVAIALEAKACMTEHVKSIPRLHAETLATGYLAKKAAPRSISVSYSIVNCAPTFVSPSGSEALNRHTQPQDARRVVEMLRTALPLARDLPAFGYDVVGVTAIECRNDGSAVHVVSGHPAPARNEHHHYERMIRSICAEYRDRFRN